MLKKFFPRSCKQLKIFISYARREQELAATLAQALRNRGDKVFFDADSLLPGTDFNIQIEKSVAKADRFIFLATSSSLSGGRYTLTELNAAKTKWPSPIGRVLTVLADNETSPDQLDPYLRSVQIIKPQGDTVADVANLIDKNRPVGLFCRLVASMLLLAVLTALTYFGWQYYRAQSNAYAEITHGPAVEIGHWLGAPSIALSLSASNPRDDQQIINMDRATLQGPKGATIQLTQAFMAIPPTAESPALTRLVLQPGDTFSADYEFIAPHRASFPLQQELAPKIRQPLPSFPSIANPLFLDEDASRLENAAMDDFVWAVGQWTFDLTYTTGPTVPEGDQKNLILTFDITEADVTTMKAWISDYATGAGVFRQWRHADINLQTTLLRKTARPASDSDN